MWLNATLAQPVSKRMACTAKRGKDHKGERTQKENIKTVKFSPGYFSTAANLPLLSVCLPRHSGVGINIFKRAGGGLSRMMQCLQPWQTSPAAPTFTLMPPTASALLSLEQ